MAHVLIKAHVQHLVRFVQHHLHDAGQVDVVVPVMVHQPAGGRHHDLAALRQTAGLLFHIGAPVDAGHLHAGHKVGQILHIPRDLLGQLPGGGQDHRLGLFLVRPDLFGHRDPKGTGLAGAGGRLGDHVPARHHQGDHLFLDLGHFIKAHPLHCLVDGLAALQFAVTHGSLRSVLGHWAFLFISIARQGQLVSPGPKNKPGACWRPACVWIESVMQSPPETCSPQRRPAGRPPASA